MPAPIALVGTSYSAEAQWNFEGALRQVLGCRVLNVSQIGRGAFAPMAAYLDNPAFKQNAPSLVVWEIPERLLPVQADLAPLKSLLERS